VNAAKLIAVLPLILLLGGCAVMEALGLATPAGDPTPAAEAASGFFASLTGIDILAMWKAGEAVMTQRGRDNLKNIVSPKTGAKSTGQSLLSLAIGVHTPADAKKAVE